MRNAFVLAALVPALFAPAPHAQVALFTDNFESYATGQLPDLQWQVASGTWEIQDGRLVGTSAGRGLSWATACPVSGDLTLQALATPRERLAPGDWAAASLALWSSASDFWRLAVVEAPTGERYAELVEMRHGTWQAQSEESTRLPLLPDSVAGFEWESDHTYLLRLSVSGERIAGEVTDDATGAIKFRAGFALPTAVDAVRQGRAALIVDALGCAFDDVRVTGTLTGEGAAQSGSGRGAAVLDTGMGDTPPELVEDLRAAFQQAGLPCRVLRAEETSGVSIPPEIGLLVLPHTRRFPLGTVEAIDAYLRAGGNAIFLGGPFGEQRLVSHAGRWQSVAEAIRAVPTDRVFIDFAHEAPADWPRFKSGEEGQIAVSVEEAGPPLNARALRVEVEALRFYDTLAKSFNDSPFPTGHSLTCFWAKGGPRTTHLVAEWREDDGSRWIAAVPLSSRWKRYVLAPEQFEYWRDNPSQGRGGLGDQFRPQHARQLLIGVVRSHSPIPVGRHTFWVAQVGSAAPPVDTGPEAQLALEAVSPPYKTYAPGAARDIVAAEEQSVLPAGLSLPGSRVIRCAMPRARGLGITGSRTGRWVPLLVARDATGRERGVPCSLYWSLTDPYPKAAWGAFGIEDPDYLRQHFGVIAPALTAMGRTLLDGVFLVKGGADRFSYRPDQRPILGGQIANRSPAGQELRLIVTVTPDDRDTILFRESFPVSAPPGVLTGASAVWDRPAEPGVYRVRCELRRGDELLDQVRHEFVRLPRLAAGPNEYVTVRAGDFWLGDRRWRPHGINYWPSSTTARETFPSWLDPAFYDPGLIERDLDALSNARLNSVSIALRHHTQLPALNHFLFRCAEHGIRANVFVGGGHPTEVNADRVVDLIEQGHLAGNPQIYAWDIAWEPTLGDYDRRKQFDDEWAAWVAEHYVSIANAEDDWGVPVPRTADGKVTGPSPEQILNDGDHRVMVAAYRRFVDDLVSKSYGAWADRVRAVDPHHLIGVRSGYGGTGQPGVDRVMPFDLIGGAKHLDFTSPEGYGLNGPWENFERGGFTTAYGRFAGAGKPVFWAEFGMSVPPDHAPRQLEAQRLLYEHMYRMVLWSGANGSASWWFPGGFRVGENSDYGIVNPDSTLRPCALEARRWAPKIAAQRGAPETDYWITIDRDLDPRGYSQVWARHREEYVEARRAGHFVDLRTAGTGTDSTNCPMIAVGNTRADGTNPPKYLNAEFNYVRVRWGGEWTDIRAGETLTVPPNRRVELVASLGNTGEARWVSPASAGSREGGVYLSAAPASDLSVHQPLRGDVPRYGDTVVGPFTAAERIDGETTVDLRPEAEARTPFGESFRFTLRVGPR